MDMKRFLLRALLLSTIVLLILPSIFAQETTAGLQGTVKDSTGAVLVKATVEASSPALIGVKKIDTDQLGYFRFANLPPGVYRLTVTATGFRTFKQENITLDVGRLPSLNIVMEVGTLTETVEVSAQSAIIDTSQSKVQTNIPDTALTYLPTQTRSFQSVIQFAPGARSEPLQGGYQIDGASNSENAYLVEGQETASLQDGHSAANVPMDFIQEVQVKSSGFEAEYGGALGGVVNVISKRGSNEWHGSVFTYYQGDKLNSAPNPTLKKNPEWSANANGAKRLDQPLEYYYPVKDHARTITPGFSIGGYLVKDRLWVFGSAAPEFDALGRTINSSYPGAVGARTFNRNIEHLLLHRPRGLHGHPEDPPVRILVVFVPPRYGHGPATADEVHNQFNSDSGTNPDNWNSGIGYVRPNVIYNTGADITLSPSLIATTRFGYFFQDNQDRGNPTGIRYIYRDTNYSYSTTNAPALATTKALNGTPMPSQFVNSTGWSNIGANTASVFDQWKRYSFNQDLAYFKSFAGTHNFKFGYGFNHGTNNVELRLQHRRCICRL